MPQNHFDNSLRSIATRPPRTRSIHLSHGPLSVALALFLACPTPSRAEVRVVSAAGEHRMSDRETKADAIRLATEQAKKQALEQVATYLESVTVVRDLDVTQDEIRSYTAGMVLILDQLVKTTLDGDVVVIGVALTAQVDTDEVARAIAVLRQNEDAREQLLALRHDVGALQHELETANRALAAATSPEQIQKLRHERNELLDRAESDAMVAQAWTDWVLVAPFAQPYPSAGLAQVQGLLGLAGRLNPNNPHLAIAQQTVGIKSPPVPPEPPRPPVPHTVPYLPGYSVVPQQPNQPEQPLPRTGRRTMPTYRQTPPPNGDPTPRTLHTYQPGSDRIPSSSEPPPDVAPRGIPPVIIYQVPQKPVTVPPSPSHGVPNKGEQ